MKETIVFVERRNDGMVELARFDGTWHGKKGLVEAIQEELVDSGIDITTTPLETVAQMWRGSYSGARVFRDEPIPVIPQA